MRTSPPNDGRFLGRTEDLSTSGGKLKSGFFFTSRPPGKCQSSFLRVIYWILGRQESQAHTTAEGDLYLSTFIISEWKPHPSFKAQFKTHAFLLSLSPLHLHRSLNSDSRRATVLCCLSWRPVVLFSCSGLFSPEACWCWRRKPYISFRTLLMFVQTGRLFYIESCLAPEK